MSAYRKSKEFVCPACGKDFDKGSQFKKHMIDKHSIEVKWDKTLNKYVTCNEKKTTI